MVLRAVTPLGGKMSRCIPFASGIETEVGDSAPNILDSGPLPRASFLTSESKA